MKDYGCHCCICVLIRRILQTSDNVLNISNER